MSKSLFELIEDDASVEEIKAAIAEGADVNEKIERNGATPLHKVAYKPWRADVIRLFIEAGADVNAQDKRSLTPLHYAAQPDTNDDESDDESKEGIKALIEAGADVNARTCDQETPLHFAADGSWRAHIVRALAEAGADVNAKNKNSYTPLHEAAKGGVFLDDDSDEGIKALIEAGADVNARTCDQETPLHLALGDSDLGFLGSLEIVRALVKAGADVNAQTESGLTPMRILRILEDNYKGGRECIEPFIALLLEAGAENY